MYESIEPITARESRTAAQPPALAPTVTLLLQDTNSNLFIAKKGTALRYYPSEESRDHMLAVITKDNRVYSVTTKTYFSTVTAWDESLPPGGLVYLNSRNRVDMEYTNARDLEKSLKIVANIQARIQSKIQYQAYKEEVRRQRVAQRAAQRASRQ